MRMFLIGMCDLFLLLYLTASSQLQVQQSSRLTVAEYTALQEQEAQLREVASAREMALAEQRQLIAQLREELTATRRDLVSLQDEQQERSAQLAASAEALERVRAQAATEAARAAEQERTVQRLAAAQATAKETEERLTQQLASLEQRAATLAAQEEEARQAVAQEQQRFASLRDEASRLREAQERATREAREAERRAEAALAQVAEMDRERQQALAAREAAILSAAEAKESLEAVQQRALSLEEYARYATLTAERATYQAERAIESEAETEAKLERVTQPADAAFQSNIASRMVSVEARWVRSALLGNDRGSRVLRGLPVQVRGRVAVFQPSAQVAFTQRWREIESLSLFVGDAPVEVLLARPQQPQVVGFAVALPLDATEVLPVDGALMPTLIAVRNGAMRGLSDRIRGLDADHYLFERDRLQRIEQGDFMLAARGFRGTGDYGEQIAVGDQIVDLEGNLLGVATDRNVVRVIGDLREWREIPVQGRSARHVLEDLAAVWGGERRG